MQATEVSAQTQQAAKILDAKGLNCPLPILRAKKALGELQSGELLKVFTTDPGSVADFAAFCNQTGHTRMAANENGGVFEFLIRKA